MNRLLRLWPLLLLTLLPSACTGQELPLALPPAEPILAALRYALRLGLYTLATTFLFVLPGLGLNAWLLPRLPLRWPERLGLAIATSLAFYPLLLLWMRVVNLSSALLITWLPALLGCVLFFAHLRRETSRIALRQPTANWPADITFLIALLGIVISRFWPVRGLPAPSWGDSVQHTLIARLIYENGGLFSSWEPYTAIHTFTYHFGFHTAAAAWMGLTSLPAPEATLFFGQVLNVLALCALYPLATRLGGSPWAGVGAVLVAGLLTRTPGVYVNWGRYTQLAGQAILPGLLWAIDRWWLAQKRPPRRFLALIVLLAAGLALTHYRVAILAVAAGLSWLLWSLWQQRPTREWRLRSGWLAAASGLAALLILPWALTVRSGRLGVTMGYVATRDVNAPDVRSELAAWQALSDFYLPALWIGAIALLLLALWRRRELAVPLLLWAVFSFAVTNPFLLRLPGTGFITNFLLLIGLYIPIALAWGWLLAEAQRLLVRFAPGRQWLLVAVLLLLAAVGTRRQLREFDPFFQMVTPADVAAFQWIAENIPADSLFAVNGFLAYGDTTIVGSDAGWWLPQFTLRDSALPPILYGIEQSAYDPLTVRQYEIDIRSSAGAPERLLPPLCDAGITHIFLGQRRGTVGIGATPLFPQEWLDQNPAFRLLHQQERAQIWQFDRSHCPAG